MRMRPDALLHRKSVNFALSYMDAPSCLSSDFIGISFRARTLKWALKLLGGLQKQINFGPASFSCNPLRRILGEEKFYSYYQ